MGDLNRSKIYIFFLVLEGEPARSVSNDAENDEEYSYDGCWLHE